MNTVSDHYRDMRIVRFIPKSKVSGQTLLPGERIVAGIMDCEDVDFAPLVAVCVDEKPEPVEAVEPEPYTYIRVYNPVRIPFMGTA